MKQKMEKDLKIGVFVATGLGLIMAAILLLGGARSIFTRQNTYVTHLSSTDGLITGAKVVLSGVPVGTVSEVDFDASTRSVKVVFSVTRKHAEWIKKGSNVEILTQGVLGDKFLSINPGEMDGPSLENGAEIPNRPSKSLTEMISKGDQLMGSLSSIAGSVDRLLKTFESGNRSEVFFESMAHTAKNFAKASERLSIELDGIKLKKASNELSGILEKINSGSGTLGALVNDPSLYEDTRALIGGANRNRIFRNLVRKTIKDSEPPKQ